MANAFTRFWRYLRTKLTHSFDDRADPEVQLEEAIAAARDQHRQLREQAITVIAHQKEIELRLGKLLRQIDETEAAAKHALLDASEAQRRNDEGGAARRNDDARALGEQLVALDEELSMLKGSALTAAAASDKAKAALETGRATLREQLEERRRLLGELEQARLQESLNATLAQMDEPVGADVPSLAEVRAKIEARGALAQAEAEVHAVTPQAAIHELEQANRTDLATDRLDGLRSDLGLAAGDQPGPPTPSP